MAAAAAVVVLLVRQHVAVLWEAEQRAWLPVLLSKPPLGAGLAPKMALPLAYRSRLL